MHNAAFQVLGLDWTYELLDVPAAGLAAAVERLRSSDVAGANVTIPHKQAVMERLDGLDADAMRARAVNTIARDGDRLLGSNTDVAGIRAAISEVGLEPRGATVAVLGRGGSARAAAGGAGGADTSVAAGHPAAHNPPGKAGALGYRAG